MSHLLLRKNYTHTSEKIDKLRNHNVEITFTDGEIICGYLYPNQYAFQYKLGYNFFNKTHFDGTIERFLLFRKSHVKKITRI